MINRFSEIEDSEYNPFRILMAICIQKRKQVVHFFKWPYGQIFEELWMWLHQGVEILSKKCGLQALVRQKNESQWSHIPQKAPDALARWIAPLHCTQS